MASFNHRISTEPLKEEASGTAPLRNDSFTSGPGRGPPSGGGIAGYLASFITYVEYTCLRYSVCLHFT